MKSWTNSCIKNVDTTTEKILLNLSENSCRKLSSIRRSRSIFLIRKDEILFRVVFSDLIDKVTYRQTLKRKYVMDRMCDKRFIEVMDRLISQFGCDAHNKILAKVRTVGFRRYFIKLFLTHFTWKFYNIITKWNLKLVVSSLRY